MLRQAALNPPVLVGNPTVEMTLLQNEVADLREKLRWALHAAPEDYHGGKMTTSISDVHWGDRAHMVACLKNVLEKHRQVIRQYRPKQLVMVWNGDAIAGRGIYREQQMDSVFSSTVEQVQLGVAKLHDIHQELVEEFPEMEVRHVVTNGNHDRTMGEPTAPLFVSTCRALSLPVVLAGNEHIENCASDGIYHIYFEHGFGHSQVSPSSPAFISAMKDRYILLSESYYGDRRIRRFNHGHTHWFQLGMERVIGVFWDTTGGFQRNERVCLGKNVRPVGICAYVSPAGYGGVLDPIGIQPDPDILRRELMDPFLMQANMRDAASALERYSELAEEAGLEVSTVKGVTPGGR